MAEQSNVSCPPPSDYMYIRVYADPSLIRQEEDPWVEVYDRNTGKQIDAVNVWSRVVDEECYQRSMSCVSGWGNVTRLMGNVPEMRKLLQENAMLHGGLTMTEWAHQNMEKVFITSSYKYWKECPGNVIFKPVDVKDPKAIYCKND